MISRILKISIFYNDEEVHSKNAIENISKREGVNKIVSVAYGFIPKVIEGKSYGI